jgi:hypothetical protein
MFITSCFGISSSSRNVWIGEPSLKRGFSFPVLEVREDKILHIRTKIIRLKSKLGTIVIAEVFPCFPTEKSALTATRNLSITRIARCETGFSAWFAFGLFAATAVSGGLWFAGPPIALRSASIV